jgi:hypothetical protein
MACRKIEEDCKRSFERKQRGFDLTAFSARNWSPKTFFNAGDVIRVQGTDVGGSQLFTGYDYLTAAPGYTGEIEPSWPATGSVVDGAVTWAAQAVTNSSMLRTMTAVEWIEDGDMLVDDEDIVNTEGRHQISAYHSGGLNGQKYLVIARVTYSDGSVEDFGLRWTIKD